MMSAVTNFCAIYIYMYIFIHLSIQSYISNTGFLTNLRNVFVLVFYWLVIVIKFTFVNMQYDWSVLLCSTEINE